MERELRERFKIPSEWEVIKGKTRSKDRINQSTEKTDFVAKSPNGQIRTFIHIDFTNHKGNKVNWSETTNN